MNTSEILRNSHEMCIMHSTGLCTFGDEDNQNFN